jgi:hypothetical protein
MKAKEAKSAAAQEGRRAGGPEQVPLARGVPPGLAEVERFLSFVYFRLDELKADLAVEGSRKKWADAQGPGAEPGRVSTSSSRTTPSMRDVHGLHVQLERGARSTCL